MTPTDAAVPPFEMRVQTRGYEVDTTRTVPAPVLLSYLEHQRWQLIARPDVGLVDHIHAGHFFVVYAQTLEIVRRVGVNVDLTVTAVLETVGRSSATVRHEIRRDLDGALVAWARVRGAWLGPDRGLARIPPRLRAVAEGQRDLLADLADPLAEPPPDPAAEPPGQASSWFAPPPRVHVPLGLEVEPPEPPDTAPDFVEHLTLRPSDCDVFGHVNASNYLRLCDDLRLRGGAAHAFGAQSLRAAEPTRRVTLKYQREALAGDEIAVHGRVLGPGAFAFAVLRTGEATPLCLARVDVAEPG